MDRPVVRPVPSVPGDGRVHLGPLLPRMGRGLRCAAKAVRRTIFSDKVAAANVVMFIITAAIFLPAVALMFLYIEEAGENQQKPTAGLHTRAQQTLILLTSSTGRTDSGRTDWQDLGEPLTGAVDPLVEVGILSDTDRKVSFEKVKMIQQGHADTASNNGFLDYPEFKDLLNIGDRFDLRLRTYPIVTTDVGNQYGSDPIRGKHIGYVAAVSDYEVNIATGAFDDPTGRATAEIAALELLDLTTDPTSQTNGFDSTWYQPCCTSVYNLPGLPPVPNNYVGAAVVNGDIIATNDREYYVSNPLEAKDYLDHFFDSYFKIDADTYRFDALVFGSDVDYTLWDTDTARENLRAFLEAGKSLVFLGYDDSADGLVNDCGVVADCLLGDGAGHDPFLVPDTTNAIMLSPNQLDTSSYSIGAGGAWPVCDDDRRGFIPVQMKDPADAVCSPIQSVYLGMTAADRYTNGGTLVLSSYDVTGGSLARKTDMALYMSNLLNVATLREAYVDYGPAQPETAPVERTERVLVLAVDGSTLDLALELYMWRTG